MTPPIRAVVVDDSHVMRSVVSDILEDGGIEVVATARDGQTALEAVLAHDPDVVTVDVDMSGACGVEAVERIMAGQPTPILVLSGRTDEDAEVTLRALEEGAVDVFRKPGSRMTMETPRLGEDLVESVQSVAAVDPTAVLTSGGTPGNGEPAGATVIVGSSTGGPTVVEELLSALPATAALRILIVQHMPAAFTGRFAARLDACSEYDVSEATDGAELAGGGALVAPGDRHLEVVEDDGERLRVALSDDPPIDSVRPAVDVTMRSAVGIVQEPLIGVVLTGMGSDGAAGVEVIAGAGGRIVVQDEASSAVFGMPCRAIETGCVDAVESAEAIPDAVLGLLEREMT